MINKIAIVSLAIFVLSCHKNSGNNTAIPGVSISDVSLPEGNTASTIFEFQVTLSSSYPKPVTVHYATADGTAKSTEDYTAITDQQLVFQPNETVKKIQVNIVGDDIKENDETFTVRLSDPTNGNLVRQTATGTIKNDDTRIN